MRVTIAAAVACLFLASPTVADPLPFQPVPVPVSSNVMVNGGCTGWYIGNDLVVTASHCMTSKLATVKFSNGVTGDAGVRYLANIDEGGDDFAVLKLHFDFKGVAAPMQIDCGVPQVGTEVYMTGFPGGEQVGLGEITSMGRISGRLIHPKVGDWPIIVPMNISSFGGFSGSAVRRVSDDKVVGILVGSIPEQRNIAFMIPIVKLCQVLEI